MYFGMIPKTSLITICCDLCHTTWLIVNVRHCIISWKIAVVFDNVSLRFVFCFFFIKMLLPWRSWSRCAPLHFSRTHVHIVFGQVSSRLIGGRVFSALGPKSVSPEHITIHTLTYNLPRPAQLQTWQPARPARPGQVAVREEFQELGNDTESRSSSIVFWGVTYTFDQKPLALRYIV